MASILCSTPEAAGPPRTLADLSLIKVAWLIMGGFVVADGIMPVWDSSPALHPIPDPWVLVMGLCITAGAVLSLIGLFVRFRNASTGWRFQFSGLAASAVGWAAVAFCALATPITSCLLAGWSLYSVAYSALRWRQLDRYADHARAFAAEHEGA